MKIDLLYFDGCPSWEAAIKNLHTALSSEGLNADINLIKVDTAEDASRLKFLGSPSILVNGMDLWPEQRSVYTLSCRVYATPQGMRGVPTVEMLQEKLRTIIKA